MSESSQAVLREPKLHADEDLLEGESKDYSEVKVVDVEPKKQAPRSRRSFLDCVLICLMAICILALMSLAATALLLYGDKGKLLDRWLEKPTRWKSYTKEWLNSRARNLPTLAQDKLTRIRKQIPLLINMNEIQNKMRTLNLEQEMDKEYWDMKRFTESLKQMDEPPFPITDNRTAIVTTCKLDVICLTNLYYMLDEFDVDTPVRLLPTTSAPAPQTNADNLTFGLGAVGGGAQTEVWLERKKVSADLVTTLLLKWSPRLQVRYFDEIESKYEQVFGPLQRLSKVPPFRLPPLRLQQPLA